LEPELEEYVKGFDNLHKQIDSIMSFMSDEELNWSPIPNESNSPGIIITHLLGAESFRIHQLAGGIDVKRDRDSEFTVQNYKIEELNKKLNTVSTLTNKILQSLKLNDLNRIHPSVREYEKDESIRWHIIHTIEHFGLHLGHLTLTKQMYDNRHIFRKQNRKK
tara:strand:- start:4594 stop:5082 length:489 start_codon:yes stop_codon:yes gene_type:complete